MTPLQHLANLQLGSADTSRLTKLIACLERVNEPTLEQLFHELFPLLDEDKAAFRQLLHAINGAIRAQGLNITISTGNKHHALNQRYFELHQDSSEVDAEFEEFSIAASYATAQESVILQQLATTGRTQLKYFVSYAHADDKVAKAFFEHLQTQLGAWQQIEFMLWHDGMLALGQDFREQIVAALNECDCGILLYSPSFFQSTFILEEELPKLLRKAYFAPVLLKPIVANQIPEILKNPQYFAFNNKAYHHFTTGGFNVQAQQC
jgi:hypothetical protein